MSSVWAVSLRSTNEAIHRSLLIRFPAAAEAIAAELAKGRELVRVELVLRYADVEFFPMHYRLPSGMSFLGDLWVRLPPRWHAVAWPLRQAWRADSASGPTFNASVNGRRFWARFGIKPPPGMPEWQWQRVRELIAHHGGQAFAPLRSPTTAGSTMGAMRSRPSWRASGAGMTAPLRSRSTTTTSA